ncbi:hypothetical protein FB451DRAFT_1187789 [Mycena latifolia]|nr:hypothetical protein FB451DRAFT_1187789 [Mycena latifolia]
MANMPGGNSAFSDVNEHQVSMYDHDGDDTNMNGDGHDIHTNHVWASQQRPQPFDHDSAQMINMSPDGGHNLHMNAVWAAEERPQRSNPAKRIAVANVSRNEIYDAREVASEAQRKATAFAREKREAEARLLQAEQQIEQLRKRDQEWQMQHAQWEGVFEQHKEQLNLRFQQELEAQRAQNFGQFSRQLETEASAREAAHQKRLAEFVAAREAEHQQQLAELKEKTRLEQEERRLEQEKTRLELEKKQADNETKLAALHARFSSQRHGPQHPQNEMEDVRFPGAPPARSPQFISKATREERRLETVIRQGPGRFPSVSMTAPPQPEPSATPPEQNTSRAPLLFDFDDPRVHERLKAMLSEATAQMGVTKSPRKKRKHKIGAAQALTTARKQQQQQLDDKADLMWKVIAREHWRLHTGLNRAKDFYDYKGVSGDTAQRCEEGETKPDETSWDLYFGSGWADSVWNKNILDKFIESVLEKRAEDPGHYDVPDVSPEYIRALFVNQLKHAHSEWKRHQPRLGESLADARERAEAYDVERRVRNVGSSRKKAKFTLRQQTAEKMVKICLAKGDPDGANTWRWLGEKLLNELEAGGMSSEEDEPVEVQCGDRRMVTTVHGIKIPPWRLRKITDYVELIDQTTPMCMTKPPAKRMRMRTDKRSTTGPPLGLPHALYDTDWLSEQKAFFPDIEEQLEISNKEFNLMEIAVANLNQSNA